ncbi:hypothetical protein VW29_19755, partial [Devosia limi DSM 17137]
MTVTGTRCEYRRGNAHRSGPQVVDRATVHDATSTRLAQKVGFKCSPDVRVQWQREVLDGQDAAERMCRSVSKVEQGGYLADLIAMEKAALDGLAQAVTQDELHSAAHMPVADRRVCIVGPAHALSVAAVSRAPPGRVPTA